MTWAAFFRVLPVVLVAALALGTSFWRSTMPTTAPGFADLGTYTLIGLVAAAALGTFCAQERRITALERALNRPAE